MFLGKSINWLSVLIFLFTFFRLLKVKLIHESALHVLLFHQLHLVASADTKIKKSKRISNHTSFDALI